MYIRVCHCVCTRGVVYCTCTCLWKLHTVMDIHVYESVCLHSTRFLPWKDLIWEQLHELEGQHGTPNGTKPVYVETDV